MSLIDRIALALCLLAVLMTAFVSAEVFDNTPHLEDEIAYVWQAQAIAGGRLSVETPPCPNCFLVPFVVDVNGQRSGKYPPGWPVVLALGVLAGARGWVNPLLAGWTAWLIYRVVKKVTDEKTALVALILAITSPFFVMNSGTLLAHPLSLFLTAAFTLSWLDTFDPDRRAPRWMTALTAALSLGVLALTRPLSAVAVGLPFAFHGLYVLWKGDATERKFALGIGGLALLVGSRLFLWQYHVTGDPLTNPYVLWWPYDTIGFGEHVGRQAGGYWPKDAIPNLQVSLFFGNYDLFGWPGFSWLFMPFGLLALLRRPRALMATAVAPSIVLAYTLYWIGSWLIGPRYYYEGLLGAVLLSAAGIRWLAGALQPASAPDWKRWLARIRFGLTAGAVMFLVACNCLFYLPQRVGGLHGLYDIRREYLEPFQTESARELTPALVIVHPLEDWIEYGRLLDLSNPYHDTPFVFTINRGPEKNAEVIAMFPERRVFHYYKHTPFVFYISPLPTW